MKWMLAVFFIIVCFASALAKTEDLQALSDILDERIKSRRSDWELLSKQITDAAILQWRSASPEREMYFVLIQNTPSTDAAAKIFSQRFPSQAGNIGIEIEGVGQEALLYEIKRGAKISIEFREANFIVRLLAPSEPKGRRLAKYVIDSIVTLQHRKS